MRFSGGKRRKKFSCKSKDHRINGFRSGCPRSCSEPSTNWRLHVGDFMRRPVCAKYCCCAPSSRAGMAERVGGCRRADHLAMVVDGQSFAEVAAWEGAEVDHYTVLV